jgi:hypothetical protein
MGILLVTFVIISLIYLIWMRKYLMDLAIELDHKTYTPSDFCLMGIDMIFDSYCPDEIEKEITTVFKEKYNVDIEYVNTAYTIKNFFDLS